ncbi:MAG: hypothetical protein AAFP76_03350 [Bacteroidota bacterium]
MVLISLVSCEKRIHRTENLMDYVPQHAENILKIVNLETSRADLTGNPLYGQLQDPLLLDFLQEQDKLLSGLNPSGESLLCFQETLDSIRHFTFITKAHPSVFVWDSIPNAVMDTLTYNKQKIQKTTFDERQGFGVTLDSVFVMSSSESILKEIIDNTTEKDPVFKRAYSLKTQDDLVSILKPDQLSINDSLQVNLASRAALEMELLPEGVRARGVVLDRDSVPQLLSIFKNLLPQQNSGTEIIPSDALYARAITYDDAQILEQNLQSYHINEDILHPIFGTVNEIISIGLKMGRATILHSLDPDITGEEFNSFNTQAGTFREIVLYDLTEESPDFNPLYPLMETHTTQVSFRLDNFFVFAEDQNVAEKIIGSYQNKATLAHASFYEQVVSQLSQASSFVLYNLDGRIDGWMAPFLGASKSKVKKFPLGVLQFSYDRDFAHVNLICKESSESVRQNLGMITQVFSQKLNDPILGNPQFFSNHRTRGKDIAVQDVNHVLHLISSSGKVLWTKQLDGAILGDIREVDILKNGKKQMAFVTENTFYILDRNGKAVAPFPKKFSDKLSQPLSLFDYDNNRKYRFVVTQGKEVFMYDRKGKIVEGFTFKKTETDIVLPPQHIRMGNKDYLLIAEKNGKLNILSRVGKERIKVNRTFEFSDTPIAREGLNFVVISNDNIKFSISQTGQVSSKTLGVTENYSFVIRGNTKVTLDDNLLRINGKLVELPFGLYTAPRIFTTNRKTYITVTDTQEKKVYVLDKNGKVLSGFPVYGNGPAWLGDAMRNQKNALTVKGGENEVLLYSLE